MSCTLLPGDIDEIGLDNLLEDTEDIQAWLTVFPHHGGKPGSKNIKIFTARFCEAVKPNIVIFSIRDNVKHFPTSLVVETVAETLENVRMFSTRCSGTLKAFIEKTDSQLHQDDVGTIHLDLAKESLGVEFIK